MIIDGNKNPLALEPDNFASSGNELLTTPIWKDSRWSVWKMSIRTLYRLDYVEKLMVRNLKDVHEALRVQTEDLLININDRKPNISPNFMKLLKEYQEHLGASPDKIDIVSAQNTASSLRTLYKDELNSGALNVGIAASLKTLFESHVMLRKSFEVSPQMVENASQHEASGKNSPLHPAVPETNRDSKPKGNTL